MMLAVILIRVAVGKRELSRRVTIVQT